MKLVYLFDEKNKNFIGTEEAFIDPEETKIKGENVYLLPANATYQEPPADVPAGHVAVFKSGSWEVVQDNRGKKILKKDKNGFYIGKSEEVEPAEHILSDEELEGIDNGFLIIENGTIIEKPQEMKNQERITELKRQLYESDYIALKIAEGSATTEEYQEIINQRAEWRAEINALGG